MHNLNKTVLIKPKFLLIVERQPETGSAVAWLGTLEVKEFEDEKSLRERVLWTAKADIREHGEVKHNFKAYRVAATSTPAAFTSLNLKWK